MLFLHQTIDKETQLAIWKLEESAEQLMENLSVRTLSDERFQKYTNPTRIKEWLAVRSLIKEVLGFEKIVSYDEEGKPYFADNSFQISISHTKGYVAILLHSTKLVGLDIEQMGDRAGKLKKRFLSELEIKALDTNNESVHVLLHWSAKETLFKIMPEIEIDFIHHLHIDAFQLKEEGSFSASESKSEEKRSYQIHYKVFADFVLTWCTK